MAPIAALYGFITALTWGVSDFFGAKAAKKFGGLSAVFFVQMAGAVLYAVLYICFMRQHTQFDAQATLYAVGGGVSYALAMAAFFKGLELGPVSIVSPIGSMYPLVTTLLLVLLFGASLSLQQYAGILMVVGGVAVASGLLDRRAGRSKLGGGPKYALLAALFWGICLALMAQAIAVIGWQLAALLEVVACAVVLVLLLPVFKKQEKMFVRPIKEMAKNKNIIVASFLQTFGILAINIGLAKAADNAAIVAAVSACYPILTVFLALRHLDEKLDPIPLAGAFVGIAGIVVLTLG